MPVDWIMGLIGGVLIGLAAAGYLLINGRIMGASGIIGGLVDGSGRSSRDDLTERVALVAGLVLMPSLVALWQGGAATFVSASWPIVIAGGLCVGVGTRLANGCTSGHGVCGISRFSLRGIVATVIYIAAGVLSVALARHLLGVI